MMTNGDTHFLFVLNFLETNPENIWIWFKLEKNWSGLDSTLERFSNYASGEVQPALGVRLQVWFKTLIEKIKLLLNII